MVVQAAWRCHTAHTAYLHTRRLVLTMQVTNWAGIGWVRLCSYLLLCWL